MAETAQDHSAFMANQTMIDSDELTSGEWQQFRQVQQKQARFHKQLKTKELSAVEEKAMGCSSPEEIADFWAEFCRRAKEKFDNRHEKGWRRLTQKYQKFADDVQVFMTHYKPLLDVCTDISKPYSAAAAATLALLFVTASNKRKVERQIALALEGAKDRLPGFKTLNECYDVYTDHRKGLRRLLLLAHLAFIDLAIEITTYYIRHGCWRWAAAAFKPMKFEDLILRFNERCHAVKWRCDELLHLHIGKMKTNIADLLQDMKRFQMCQGTTYLSKFYKKLGLSTWCPGRHVEELEYYRRSVQDEELYEYAYEQIMRDSNDIFRREDAFTKWSQSGDSSILILTGINNTNIAELKRHCWLSPLAIDTIGRGVTEGNTCAHYIFNSEPHRTSIRRAILMIIFQLLNFKSAELEKHQMALTSHAETLSRLDNRSDTQEMVAELSRLLCETVRMFKSRERINIIVDRLDICQGSERNDMLQMMVDMSNEARCIVKTLVVTQWVSDWKPNYRELRSKLHPPATVQESTLVQKARWGGY